MGLIEELYGRVPPAERGRCASCGFCGLLGRAGWQEVTRPQREAGYFDPFAIVGTPEPHCLEEAADLVEEMRAEALRHGELTDPGFIPRDAFLAVINSDRECPRWYPHQPGYDPKEHRREMRVLQLDEQRARTQAQLAASLAGIEADSKEISRRNAETAASLADANRTLQATRDAGRRWAVAATIIAVLVLAIATLTFLASTGHL